MADKKDDSSQASKVVTAGIIGVAVGAAGMYLRDKDNQKKVSEKLDEIRNWSDKTVEDWKQKMNSVEEDADTLAENLQKKAEEKNKELKEMDTDKPISPKSLD